eukprot:TRINITY_DN47324_c0_g1_i1.p1 TRINITY_DN47324_c0_g1~~TRINITY_DN47324_c0_g1_i1.p1  ORF type:complete len:207 (+),score=25.56 TRINITY_DN47324_c0_g1_i1:70-690(+)
MNNSSHYGWRWWLPIPPGSRRRLPEVLPSQYSEETRSLAHSLARCHLSLAAARKSRKKRTLLRAQISKLKAQLDEAAPRNAAASLLYGALVAAESRPTEAHALTLKQHTEALETAGQCLSWISTVPSSVLEQICAQAITGWGVARNMLQTCHRLRSAAWITLEAGRSTGQCAAEHLFCLPSSPEHRPAECFEQGGLKALGSEVVVS